MRSSKEGTEAGKSGSFKDGQEWGKQCFEDLDQRRMVRPATRTWSTDFLLREGFSRKEIEKRNEKQVHTMAAGKKIAQGSDWHISLWTADAKVPIQKNGGMQAVSEGTWGAREQLERRAAKRDD
jgi:hypothetical protein